MRDLCLYALAVALVAALIPWPSLLVFSIAGVILCAAAMSKGARWQ